VQIYHKKGIDANNFSILTNNFNWSFDSSIFI